MESKLSDKIKTVLGKVGDFFKKIWPFIWRALAVIGGILIFIAIRKKLAEIGECHGTFKPVNGDPTKIMVKDNNGKNVIIDLKGITRTDGQQTTAADVIAAGITEEGKGNVKMHGTVIDRRGFIHFDDVSN